MDSQHTGTPLGATFSLGFAELSVFVDDAGTVIASGFDSLDAIAAGRPYRRGDLPSNVTEALEAWTNGDFGRLMDVPVWITGTPKLVQLREQLRKVPAGSVVTYGELADRAGLRHLPRLAGRACSENPCLLFVPCHRVVAASHVGPPVVPGSYAATEGMKAQLLTHEGVSVREAKPRDESSGF